MMIDQGVIKNWNKQFGNGTAEDLLKYFLEKYKGKIALSSSMSVEDQLLTEMVLNIDSEARIFTLDTGRLFPETYDLIDRTAKKYNANIEVYFPESADVEEMVRTKGMNLFYSSIENRKLCCQLRKLKPLARALQGLEVWITGLRREQSVTRVDMQMVEWDENNNLLKLNPLINWTEDEVWERVKKNNIPYNPLHKKGFVSIGCQPCTRAVLPGEDPRAGRWWWENPDTRECGLHKR
jgi:phosphoadenosine phosphosulfate reductase